MKNTFRSFALERLGSLCRAVDYDVSRAVDPLDTLIEPFGDLPVGRAPRWPSDITDDATPIELSLSMEGTRWEPRFLVEPQGEDGSLATRWRAGQDTNRRIAKRYGVSLDRVAAIEDLFEPVDEEGKFAMWHAATTSSRSGAS